MSKSIPLKCPCEQKADLISVGDAFICSHSGCCHATEHKAFQKVNGIPVLISEENTDTLCESSRIMSYVARSPKKLGPIKRLLVGESKTTQENCAEFVKLVKSQSKRPRVLVIGSGEQGSATGGLWGDHDIEIHGVDIYASDTVDVVCDGHYLPLTDDQYDGVWIQAVLEHVVEPHKVVDEISRVLKEGGVVYAETPFMQQVHEGAYDFTRFTVLGHRYLFKNFEALKIGGNKGPELVLAWSIRYFMWSISRNRVIGRISGIIFGLLMRPFRFLMSNESYFDGPSGVFFLGRKKAGYRLKHKDLPALYKGAMK